MNPRNAPEAAIRRGIRDTLRMLGFDVCDMEQNRATRQTAGFTDLVVFGRGSIVFAEVKTPTGKLTAHQVWFRDTVLANNGLWACWRSTEEAIQWMQARKILPPPPKL